MGAVIAVIGIAVGLLQTSIWGALGDIVLDDFFLNFRVVSETFRSKKRFNRRLVTASAGRACCNKDVSVTDANL